VTGVAPVAISLVSLLLSLYTIVDANRDPSVSLTLPDIVRVAQGQQDAWIYLQPRFVGTGRNQRVAVISDVRLRVEPEQGEPMAFTWDEQGTWQFSTEDKSLTWIYLADPAPLVVSQSTPQLPINLYVGPEGWEWAPGTYLLVVEADQSTTDEVLRAAVRITLYPGGIERIQADRGANLIDVVTEPA
jgi:hypothetical protein